MDAELLHPEIRKVIARTPRMPFGCPWLLPLGRLMYNFGARTKLGPGVEVTTQATGGVQLRVYRPKEGRTDAGLLWMFGGGHVAGKPAHLNGIASQIAAELGVSVFVPKYRVAPEHPFPADLDDCFMAWNWLVENAASEGLDPNKIGIGGHSAGGGLAAGLAQRIYDEGGQQPKVQCLFYPMLDDRTASERAHDEKNHFIWNNKANRTAWYAYLRPLYPGRTALPNYASPARRHGLTGLPKAWIGICGLDLFAEECRVYAEDLKKADVSCEVMTVEGVPHAFEIFRPESDIAVNFVNSALGFLKRNLLEEE